MSASRADTELQVQHAFFSNADNAAGSINSRENPFNNGAAFIQYESGSDALLFKPVNYVWSPKAADFSLPAKAK